MSRYHAPAVHKNKSNIHNSENTVLFELSNFQYIYGGFVLSTGKPFRQPVLQNCKSHVPTRYVRLIWSDPLVISIVVATLISLKLLFDDDDWLTRILQLTKVPLYFKWELLSLAIMSCVCAWSAERFVFPWLAKFLGRFKRQHGMGQRKRYKGRSKQN